MIRVSEGKYRIGDTKVLIFVRVSFINLSICRCCLGLNGIHKKIAVFGMRESQFMNIQQQTIILCNIKFAELSAHIHISLNYQPKNIHRFRQRLREIKAPCRVQSAQHQS